MLWMWLVCKQLLSEPENRLWRCLAFCVEVAIISDQSTLLENRRQAEADCSNKLSALS